MAARCDGRRCAAGGSGPWAADGAAVLLADEEAVQVVVRVVIEVSGGPIRVYFQWVSNW